MIKKLNIFMTIAATMMFVACSNEDLPLTHADGYGEINFSVGAEPTRADGDEESKVYIPYDYSRDPHSMGVYGWHDLSSSTFNVAGNKMFVNTEVTATLDNDIVTWSYDDKKYWFDYAVFNNFDFFGYMPHNADATLTYSAGDVYTLTMPVEFDDDYAVFSPEETALVCAEPQHKVLADGVIPFRMDQTLTAYKLVFQLGDDMDDVRDFIIKDVKIYGAGLATSGVVSRSYTWDTSTSGIWVSGDITWSDVQTTQVDSVNAYSIPYRNNSDTDDELADFYNDNDELLRVTKTPVQWGTPVYMIPVEGSEPVFEVIYDAVVTDEDGNDIVTRNNIHSIIRFSDDNFGSRVMGGMGKTQPITIKIVPDHLYVLADADQTFGWLPLE